jgi:uncharacterized protein (TIGR02246 family)
MRTGVILTLSVLALILGGCGDNSPAVNKIAIEKSVQEVEKGMEKALAARDAAAFVSNYAADAVLMTPGMPPMKGTDGIRAGTSQMLTDPNLKLNFASDRVEVADSGELAATRGSYTMTATSPVTKKPVTETGSYVTVFRKQKDGAWKAVLDISTSEAPPVAPPAPKAAVKKKKGKKR